MLETFLVDNKINMSNFRRFIDEFNIEKMIPFIGAGASVPTGELDWDKLFDLLNKKHKSNIKLIKNKDNNVDYPLSFSRIYDRLVDKSLFFEDVFKSTAPTITSFSGLHSALVKYFKTFLTTNYDTPIESAFYDRFDKRPNRYYFSPFHNDINDNAIIYLHGHKDINFAILKHDDYEYFYPSVSGRSGIPILERFLNDIYTSKVILFIGFSFNDNYVTDYLSTLSRQYSDRVHYWILSDTNSFFVKHKKACEDYLLKGDRLSAEFELDRFFKSYKDINIYPIVYTNDRHVFIEDLLRTAASSNSLLSIKSMPISGDIR